MQEELKRCEEITMSVRQLLPGDNTRAEYLKNELTEIVKSSFPEKDKYFQQLNSLSFREANNAEDHSFWQVQKDNLFQLTISIQEELNLKIKKQQQEKSSQRQLEDLKLEILRVKNDSEKDLILERNNHQYLKKKYDHLKTSHEELEKSYLNLLGSKNQWYLYFLITFPLVFFILTFDSFIYINYFNLLKFNVLVKTGLAFSVISGLLYIPLRDKRLLILPIIFLALIFILQLL
ncbi:MAG: hypothetical protein ACOCWM_04415 [Cyclobacteriaceae bacterium]